MILSVPFYPHVSRRLRRGSNVCWPDARPAARRGRPRQAGALCAAWGERGRTPDGRPRPRRHWASTGDLARPTRRPAVGTAPALVPRLRTAAAPGLVCARAATVGRDRPSRRRGPRPACPACGGECCPRKAGTGHTISRTLAAAESSEQFSDTQTFIFKKTIITACFLFRKVDARVSFSFIFGRRAFFFFFSRAIAQLISISRGGSHGLANFFFQEPRTHNLDIWVTRHNLEK